MKTFSDWYKSSSPHWDITDQVSAGVDAMNNHWKFIVQGMWASPYTHGLRYTGSEIHNWKKEIAFGGEYKLIAWMLTLLPNIEYLSLPGRYTSTPLANVATNVTSAIPNQSPSRRPFARLRHVALHDSHNDEAPNFGLLQAFAPLSSVKTLSGKSVYGRGPTWNQNAVASALSEVHFVQSSIDSRAFEALLWQTTALRHFTYHYTVKTDQENSGVQQLAETFHMLVRYTRHSLVSLSLRTENLWADSRLQETSFRDFAVLKTLSVDYDMLIDGGYRTIQWKRDGKYRLVDILPASLETLEVSLFP